MNNDRATDFKNKTKENHTNSELLMIECNGMNNAKLSHTIASFRESSQAHEDAEMNSEQHQANEGNSIQIYSPI